MTDAGGGPAGLKAGLDAAPDAPARTALLREALAARGPAPDLRGARLTEVSLPRARLRRADLAAADLRGADLSGAFLAQSDVTDARFDNAALRGADFSHARAAAAHFGEADLRDALFEDADLRGAHLRFADLRGAALEGADLAGADLWGAHLDAADLSGAVLQGAALREAKAPGADFSRADLRRAALANTDLAGARFAGADLREAVFGDARLDGADFADASLQDVDLSRCSLSGCGWDRARLDRTVLHREQLGPVVGEERDGRWEAAAGAYLALERNFSDLGAVDASSWAYGRRRRMQKRVAARAAAEAWRRRDWGAWAGRSLTFVGDTLVEWSCGYGESLGRVFATLIFAFFAFIVVYAVTGSVTRTTGAAHVVTLRLVDLAVFSMEAMTNTQGSAELLRPSHTYSVFLSGAQTLVSIFLTGLLGFVAGNRIRR